MTQKTVEQPYSSNPATRQVMYDVNNTGDNIFVGNIEFFTVVIRFQPSVVTIGEVHPGETGTQPIPWAVRNFLSGGYDDNGTLNIGAGGDLSPGSGS